MRPIGTSPKVKEFILNLNQAAATYDGCTASGDVEIISAALYVKTAAGGLTSVSVQSNQTTPVVLLTAAEGAVANLTVDKNISIGAAALQTVPWTLRSGQKIQYTIVDNGNAGDMRLIVRFQPISGGANLV